jgi:hypothetical protein
MNNVMPVVGMGATMSLGSDRYAYTVVAVLNPKKVMVVRDDVVYRADRSGYGEIYSPGAGDAEVATLRKDGRWHLGTKLEDPFLRLGVRNAYCDPHF